MGVPLNPDGVPDVDQTLERLVAQFQIPLLRTCYMILRDRTLSEDAVQETFMKAYRNLGDFRGESSEKTWLMRIAMNTCRDIRKSNWFRYINRAVTPEMLQYASVDCEAYEETLINEVMRLPFALRGVVLLYYYQNMDTNEIAEILGIARSSVSGRLQRARKKLRAVLERMDSDEG